MGRLRGVNKGLKRGRREDWTEDRSRSGLDRGPLNDRAEDHQMAGTEDHHTTTGQRTIEGPEENRQRTAQPTGELLGGLGRGAAEDGWKSDRDPAEK